jgi:hypothetical protein
MRRCKLRAPRLIHVGFTTLPTQNTLAVDAIISSEAFDWMRYHFGHYVLWTSSDCETIGRKLARELGGDAHLLIVPIVFDDFYGALPQSFWDWLKRDRGRGALAVWNPETNQPV